MDANIDELLSYFRYDHLPARLQEFSKPFCDLANSLVERLDQTGSCQLEEGLKRLLEAKDCFVRASLKLLKEEG